MPNTTSLFATHDDLKPLVRIKPDERRTLCDQFAGGETDAEAGEHCRDGIYREASCRQHPSRCATLLSSYPGWSGIAGGLWDMRVLAIVTIAVNA